MYGGCRVGWVAVWWITTVVIIRPSQPSLAGVGAGAELAKRRSRRKMPQSMVCSEVGIWFGIMASNPIIPYTNSTMVQSYLSKSVFFHGRSSSIQGCRLVTGGRRLCVQLGNTFEYLSFSPFNHEIVTNINYF